MRRTLISGAVAVVLFATVAFAAGTFVVHTSLGTGSEDPITTCTTDVYVDYEVEWSDGADGFIVTAVNVTTSHAACDGLTATVELTDAAGFGISTVSGSIGSLTTGFMTLTTPEKVVDIDDVHVLIH